MHRPALQALYARRSPTTRRGARAADDCILPAVRQRPPGEDTTVELAGETLPLFPTYVRNTDPARRRAAGAVGARRPDAGRAAGRDGARRPGRDGRRGARDRRGARGRAGAGAGAVVVDRPDGLRAALARCRLRARSTRSTRSPWASRRAWRSASSALACGLSCHWAPSASTTRSLLGPAEVGDDACGRRGCSGTLTCGSGEAARRRAGRRRGPPARCGCAAGRRRRTRA